MVSFGTTNDSVEGTILTVLENVYAPLFFAETSWPDIVKSDFCSNMHSCLANLTDIHYKILGLTVMYIPQEGQDLTPEAGAKDRELVKRLEESKLIINKMQFNLPPKDATTKGGPPGQFAENVHSNHIVKMEEFTRHMKYLL